MDRMVVINTNLEANVSSSPYWTAKSAVVVGAGIEAKIVVVPTIESLKPHNDVHANVIKGIANKRTTQYNPIPFSQTVLRSTSLIIAPMTIKDIGETQLEIFPIAVSIKVGNWICISPLVKPRITAIIFGFFNKLITTSFGDAFWFDRIVF